MWQHVRNELLKWVTASSRATRWPRKPRGFKRPLLTRRTPYRNVETFDQMLNLFTLYAHDIAFHDTLSVQFVPGSPSTFVGVIAHFAVPHVASRESACPS